MNSLEIREAKMKLINMVNKIPLPLEVKRMMLSEVMNELEGAVIREIDSLLKGREENQKKENEDEQSI